MFRNRINGLGVVLFIFFLICSGGLWPSSFEFLEINCGNIPAGIGVGDLGTNGWCVNNAGKILFCFSGYNPASGFEYRQYLWNSENNSLIPVILTIPGADVTSFNNKNQLVGNANGHGFIGNFNGAISDVIFPNSRNTQCFTINDNGQVLGVYSPDSGEDSERASSSPIPGFIRQPNGSYTQIDLPGWPSDMNNKGQIVGTADDLGFILQPDGTVTLFSVPGAVTTMPSGINDNGDIVGGYYDGSDNMHGFIFYAGASSPERFDANFPFGPMATPMDINNLGHVTGSFYSIVYSDQGVALFRYHGFVAFPEKIGVRQYRQCQLRSGSTSSWRDDHYANNSGTDTICKKGCALTSLSMALHALNITEFNLSSSGGANWRPNDPGYLNVFLNTVNGYDNGKIKWAAAVNAANKGGKFNLKFDFFQGCASSLKNLNGALNTVDNALLKRGLPIIVGVKIKRAWDSNIPGRIVEYPGHYVLVTGIERTPSGIKHIIADPINSAPAFLEDYNYLTDLTVSPPLKQTYPFPVFETRGTVGDPVDLSSISVISDANAEVMVTDASGRRTGFEPISGERLQNIPHSAYFIDSIDDAETGEISLDPAYMAILQKPAAGEYQAVVTGTKTGYYRVQVDIANSRGIPQEPLIFEGAISPGRTETFQFTYTIPTPQEKLDGLIGEIQQSSIGDILKTKLTHKLTIARNGIKRGKIDAVLTLLREVQTTINVKTGTSIETETAVRWLDILEDVISVLTDL